MDLERKYHSKYSGLWKYGKATMGAFSLQSVDYLVGVPPRTSIVAKQTNKSLRSVITYVRKDLSMQIMGIDDFLPFSILCSTKALHSALFTACILIQVTDTLLRVSEAA